MVEPPPEPRKKRRTALEWEEKVGSRLSIRDRKPSQKGRIFDAGTDPDHPTDEQAQASPLAKEWAKAHLKERTQLEKYRVFTKVDKLPEGVKPVDTK